MGNSKLFYMLDPSSNFFTASNSYFMDAVENQSMTVYKNNFMTLRLGRLFKQDNEHKL